VFWYVVHDVDLVIRARREDLTEAERRDICDLFAPLDGFEYDFFEHHDVTMNRVLPVDFEAIWQEALPVKHQGERVLVMRGEDMLLAAAINACRKRFFRLRSLFDVATLLESYLDLDWAWLVARARRFGCCPLLYTALLVTQQTLGGAINGEMLNRLSLHPLRAATLRHFVAGLLPRLSFATTYPLSGNGLFGRPGTLSLLLTYASYSPGQVWKKLGEIYSVSSKQMSHTA
jgi:hypothetical protein